MARSMVIKWGLNDKIGAVDYGNDNQNPYQQSKAFSEETAKQIDQEVKKIIDNASKQAKKILTDKKSDFELFYKWKWFCRENTLVSSLSSILSS